MQSALLVGGFVIQVQREGGQWVARAPRVSRAKAAGRTRNEARQALLSRLGVRLVDASRWRR